MSRAFFLVGLGFASLALVLAIVGLATSNWIVSCSSMDAVITYIANLQGGIDSDTLDIMRQVNANKQLCFNLGLFAIVIDQSVASVSTALDINSHDSFVRGTIAMLIIGTLVLAGGIILHGLSTFSATFRISKSSASTCGKIGFSMLICGTLFFFIGMLVYTIGQSDTIHNPMAFFTQFFTVFVSSVSELFSPPGGSPGVLNGNSPYPDLGNTGIGNSMDFGNAGNSMDFGNVANPGISDSFGIGSSSNSGNYSFANLGNPENLAAPPIMDGNNPLSGFAFLNKFDPDYGYSFLFGWFAFVFACIASSAVGIGALKMARENGNAPAIPMK